MRIIDLHTHYGKWFYPIGKGGIKDFLDIMDRNEIEISVVSSSLALLYDFREGNRELMDILRSCRNLLGYLFLNPNYLQESFREMDKYLHDENFVGLGELYDEGFIGSKTLSCDNHKRILERLLKRFSQRVVLFHCLESGIFQLLEIASEFKEISFIAGHMGSSEYELAAETFKNVTNVYLEVCSRPFRGKIETVTRKIGAERVVFGSDYCLVDPAFMIGMVVESRIGEDEKERIFYLNARNLLMRE